MKKLMILMLAVLLIFPIVSADNSSIMYGQQEGTGNIIPVALNSRGEQLIDIDFANFTGTLVQFVNVTATDTGFFGTLGSIIDEILNAYFTNIYVSNQTTTANLTVTGNATLESYLGCTALETDANGNLVCGADDEGSGAEGAITEESFWGNFSLNLTNSILYNNASYLSTYNESYPTKESTFGADEGNYSLTVDMIAGNKTEITETIIVNKTLTDQNLSALQIYMDSNYTNKSNNWDDLNSPSDISGSEYWYNQTPNLNETNFYSSGGIWSINLTFLTDFFSDVFCKIGGNCQVANLTVNEDLNVSGSIWGRDCVDDGDVLISRLNKGVTGANGETGTLTTTNLKGIWHFEEGTGNPTDDSGNSHTLTNSGADWIANGKYGSALDFVSANTDDLNLADHADFDITATDSFSIGMWFKSTDTSDGGTDGFIAKRAGTGLGWELTSDGSDHLRFTIDDNAGANPQSIAGTTDIFDQEWHFITAIRDVSNDELRIYVDGNLDQTPATDTSTGTLANADSLFIGAKTTNTNNINGIIDEPFWIKTSLTANEVILLNNSRWWGRTYLDGKFSQGYYAFIGNSLSYATAGNIVKDKGTIEFWFKPSWNAEDNDGQARYFFVTNPSSTNNMILLDRHATNHVIYFRMVDNSGTQNVVVFNPTNADISAGEWHYLSITWDINNNQMAIYLDGELKDNTPSGSTYPVLMQSTMYIGKNGLAQQYEAQSIIDEFKIYDRPLSADEIKQQYNCQRPTIMSET